MAATPKKRAAKTAGKGKGAAGKLTLKQRRFVLEYMKDGNATQAAGRAGYSDPNIGRQLITKNNVAAAIAAERAKIEPKLEMTRDEFLARWRRQFVADPRDLVEYKRGNCRHCWGLNHAYQWTTAELLEAQQKAVDAGKPMPDETGGVGFVRSRPPHPDCPECGGEGYGRVIIRDSRDLSPEAAALLAGYKRTKDGEEVVMHSQQKAGETLGKIMGWLDDRPTVKVDVAVDARQRLASALERIPKAP